MDNILKKVVILILSFGTKHTSCTIAGITFMDPLNFKPLPKPKPGTDPCNPLYWYPKNIPEYCYISSTPQPAGGAPIPIPIPVHVPQPIPQPVPVPSLPVAVPGDPPPPPTVISAAPIAPVPMPAIPLPYGLPIAPSNPMLPVAPGYPPPIFPPYPPPGPAPGPYPPYPPPGPVPGPYPPYPQMPMLPPGPYPPQEPIGMVPGIPDIVSRDGGINILPFSDAYTDLLNRRKEKMLRRRLHHLMRDYDDYPDMRLKRRGRRKHRHRWYY